MFIERLLSDSLNLIGCRGNVKQCFLFFIVVVIPGHNLGNSQVSVNRTIGPTLVFSFPKSRFSHEVVHMNLY